MATPPDLLIALLAVQINGGENVLESTPSVKALKKQLEEAKKKSWVELVSKKEPHPTKKTAAGKPSMVTVKSYQLTESGREQLRKASDPTVQGIDQISTGKAIRDRLTSEVEQLRADLLARLDEGLGLIKGRLEELPEPPEEVTITEEPRPPATQQKADAEPVPMRDVIADAYRDLCLRLEFEDGLVDIPRLLLKVQQVYPDLDPEQFKQELIHLRDEDTLQLRIMNEVHQLSESERVMGIWHNNGLLYYIHWPEERP